MSEWHTGWTEGYASARSEAQAEILRLRAENETHKEIAVRETMKVATLRAALKRMLLEFDFMIEGGIISDCRNDVIFENARTALNDIKSDKS